MDSTKVHAISVDKRLDLFNNQLSELKSNSSVQYESLKSDLEDIKKKSNLTVWTPIIAALIAAIIGTLLAQVIDRIRKRLTEEGKEIRETKSKCVNIVIKLKECYRQLAMYKFHTQYWWHCHITEGDKKEAEAYYSYHLNSQLKAQVAEEKIGDLNAEFHAEITRYERLKGKRFNVDSIKSQIEAITFKKAKEYASSISHHELRNVLAEQDEKELRESYFQNLELYREVIKRMK